MFSWCFSHVHPKAVFQMMGSARSSAALWTQLLTMLAAPSVLLHAVQSSSKQGMTFLMWVYIYMEHENCPEQNLTFIFWAELCTGDCSDPRTSAGSVDLKQQISLYQEKCRKQKEVSVQILCPVSKKIPLRCFCQAGISNSSPPERTLYLKIDFALYLPIVKQMF